MHDKFGLLIVEEENGAIGVQVFADPAKAKESFDNWIGQVGQKPQRARFLTVTDKSEKVDVVVKDLPVIPEKKDHYVIGQSEDKT